MKNKLFIKIVSIIFILILILIPSSSASDILKNLDTSYYILALGIDITENNNLTTTIQILESSSSKDSIEKPILYSTTGANLESCLNSFENTLSKTINLSHCSTIIFSKELLKNTDKTKSIISTLGNNTEIRNTSYILCSEDNSYLFLENISNTNEIFSPKIYRQFIETTYNSGYNTICTFGNLFNTSKDSGKSSLIPLIYNDKDNSLYKLNGAIIYSSNNTNFTLNSNETFFYNLLNNKIKLGKIYFFDNLYTKNFINLNIKQYKKTKIKPHIINNSPFIISDIYPEFIITSSGKDYDYLKLDNIINLEKELNKLLSNNITNFCYTLSQDFNSDLININDKLKINFLTLDAFSKLNFNKLFPKSIFKVNIHSKVISSNLFNKQ